MTGLNPEPDAPPTGGSRRLIGPFTVRQLRSVLIVMVVGAVVLVILTRPIGPGSAPGASAGSTQLPGATPFLVGSVKVGVTTGAAAPELAWTSADGTLTQLQGLDGKPVQLQALRGKLVWLNFWATWCPPCQSETPVLRDMDARYRSLGLAIVGIAVQETTPDDVRAYAARYDLQYPIAFDATADVFNLYRIFALPTQVFIGPDGRVLEVVNGPMTDDSAAALIAPWLPAAPVPAGS